MKKVIAVVIMLMLVASLSFAQDFLEADEKVEKINQRQVRVKKILYDSKGKEVIVHQVDYDVGSVYANIMALKERIAELQDPKRIQRIIDDLKKEKAKWEAMKAALEQ